MAAVALITVAISEVYYRRRPVVYVESRIGEAGRWRWQAYSRGQHVAGETIGGSDTQQESIRAFKDLRRARIHLKR